MRARAIFFGVVRNGVMDHEKIGLGTVDHVGRFGFSIVHFTLSKIESCSVYVNI